MTSATKTVNRVVRGDRITARGQNDLVDAVNTIGQATVLLGREAVSDFGRYEMLQVYDTDAAFSQVRCERASGVPVQNQESILVQLWPSLYDQTNYTYSDNNNRTHTPSGTSQVLTPPLKVGEWILCRFMLHPAAPAGPFDGWLDVSPDGRMWAEVP